MSEAVAAPAAGATEGPHPGPVVSASDLTRRYGEGETAVDALRGVSLDVPKGQLTAVMGPSGSGKSTLMHILAGLDKPTSGEVEIAGTKISKLSDSELTKLRRKHIGFIFQFFNLLPMLTAEENVVLPLSLAGEKPDKAWVDELMQKIGLADRRKHRPSELSGGHQQRVAIGRAREGEVERGHVRAEDDLLGAAAEEAARRAPRLADEQVAPPARLERSAEVCVRFPQIPRDRVDHLVGHLSPAGRVEKRKLAAERGEPSSDRGRIDYERRHKTAMLADRADRASKERERNLWKPPLYPLQMWPSGRPPPLWPHRT